MTGERIHRHDLSDQTVFNVPPLPPDFAADASSLDAFELTRQPSWTRDLALDHDPASARPTPQGLAGLQAPNSDLSGVRGKAGEKSSPKSTASDNSDGGQSRFAGGTLAVRKTRKKEQNRVAYLRYRERQKNQAAAQAARLKQLETVAAQYKAERDAAREELQLAKYELSLLKSRSQRS